MIAILYFRFTGDESFAISKSMKIGNLEYCPLSKHPWKLPVN